MACPSFSLPAHLCCPADVACMKLAAEMGLEAICGRCYASKSRYKWKNVAGVLKKRQQWWQSTAPLERAEQLAEAVLAEGDVRYFRCYDSGDLDRSAFETWWHFADLLPRVTVWIPSRTWILDDYLPDLIELNRHPRIVVRPSALCFDDAPPSIYGLSAGTSSAWKEPMKADRKCTEQCGLQCRICWTHPELSINYKRK
jgi:hypothetical protein